MRGITYMGSLVPENATSHGSDKSTSTRTSQRVNVAHRHPTRMRVDSLIRSEAPGTYAATEGSVISRGDCACKIHDPADSPTPAGYRQHIVRNGPCTKDDHLTQRERRSSVRRCRRLLGLGRAIDHNGTERNSAEQFKSSVWRAAGRQVWL